MCPYEECDLCSGILRAYPNGILFQTMMLHAKCSIADAAKAIRQAVYSFYNPTMCLEVAVFNRLRLLFPQLNMGFITTCFLTGFQPFGCIAFVHAQMQPLTRSACL